MNGILIALLAGIALSLIRNVLFQLQAWQIKEYRVRRMIAAFDELRWRKQITHPISIFKWLIAFIFVYELLTNSFTLSIEVIAGVLIGLYFVERGLSFTVEIFKRSFARPSLTIKAILIGIFALVLAGAVGWIAWHSMTFLGQLAAITTAALIADRALLIGVAVAVLVLKLPTYLVKQRIFERATAKRVVMKDIKVIGITGSYAKSSVKEFTAAILSSMCHTLKTPENVNTDIGIAKLILAELKSSHGAFVVEMGAYHRGEIAQAAKISRPNIAVLTGLNDQHIALFGSRENIDRAKYELMESLPAGGIAVFNIDNKRVKRLYRKYTGAKLSYGFGKDAHIRCTRFEAERKGIVLAVEYKEQKGTIHVGVFGRHNALNVLGAIAACVAAGVPWNKIVKAAGSIKPHSKGITIKVGHGGAKIIDDSYSSNVDGVLAALEVLATQEAKKRIVLFPSLIELGGTANDAHKQLGEALIDHADQIYVLDHTYSRALKAGAGDKSNKFIFTTASQLNSAIEQFDSDTAVLITGRMLGEYKSVYKKIQTVTH